MPSTVRPTLSDIAYTQIASADAPILLQAFGPLRIVAGAAQPSSSTDAYHILDSVIAGLCPQADNLWAMMHKALARAVATAGLYGPRSVLDIDPDNLKLWLRPDNLSAGLLNAWVDEIAGYSFARNNTLGPIVIPAVLNGWPVVQFGGVAGEFLKADDVAGNFGVSGAANLSMFVVLQSYVSAIDYVLNITSSSGTLGSVAFLVHPSTNNAQFAWTTSSGTNAVTSTDGQWPILSTKIVSIVRNSSLLSMYRNGITPPYSAASTVPAIEAGRSQRMYVGVRGNGANNFTGYVAEVIIWRSQLVDADRQIIEGYLAHKYALTANLPVEHPYKSTPPW